MSALTPDPKPQTLQPELVRALLTINMGSSLLRQASAWHHIKAVGLGGYSLSGRAPPPGLGPSFIIRVNPQRPRPAGLRDQNTTAAQNFLLKPSQQPARPARIASGLPELSRCFVQRVQESYCCRAPPQTARWKG